MRRRRPPRPPLRDKMPPPDARTVAECAFAYERAVLELDHVSEETKTRALRHIACVIVPLIGWLPYHELTPELEQGVADILVDWRDGDVLVFVWRDFTRWSRAHIPTTGPTFALVSAAAWRLRREWSDRRSRDVGGGASAFERCVELADALRRWASGGADASIRARRPPR
jgi:hypothetical protein